MLQLRDIRKTFNAGTDNEVRGLDGVTLDFEPGTWTVVIGSNGSGKSTMQSAISGTFGLDGGSITVGGTDITAWPEHRRAHIIGRVFQDPYAGSAPSLTVAENLALAEGRGTRRTLAPLLRRSRRAAWREMLAEIGLGLERRLDDPIGLLSGGQRQSITLLMATATAPKVLLLDEHTAALDPRSADQVIQLTSRIVARHRATTIMVTHSMAQAAALGDRLVAMHRGRVYLDVRGADKRRLRVEDLHDVFAQMRQDDRLDHAALALLAAEYA
ncbi:MAG: ATP-binding cassette domain-containing protein [Phycisphaerales bacterium]|nr:ATP-binding cassette domain-containing protein [Phycisphaerales bacterium]